METLANHRVMCEAVAEILWPKLRFKTSGWERLVAGDWVKVDRTNVHGLVEQTLLDFFLKTNAGQVSSVVTGIKPKLTVEG